MTDARRMHAYRWDDLSSYFFSCRQTLEEPALSERPHEIASASASAAVYAYAIGEPLATVREYAKRALLACRAAQGKRRSLELLTRPPGKYGMKFDDSVHASNVILSYLYWGILIGEDELLRALAENTWDPGRPTNFTVFPIFRVAYAVRDLVLGRPAEALEELGFIRPTARKSERLQARVLSAIARESGAECSEALGELVRTHRVATNQVYLPDEKMFCLSAGALAKLALNRGLMAPDSLPPDADCFPKELVLDGAGPDRGPLVDVVGS